MVVRLARFETSLLVLRWMLTLIKLPFREGRGVVFAIKYAGLQSGNVSLCNFGIVGCTVFGLWRLGGSDVILLTALRWPCVRAM